MEILKKCTLLFVENDQDSLDIYSRKLRDAFKEVYIARDGKEGLRLFETHQPDFILTDIKMPELSGIEMAKEIRKHDKKKRIVFFTAYTPTDYLLEAIDLQPVKYLVKPMSPADLIEYFTLEAACTLEKSVELAPEVIYLPSRKEVVHSDGSVKLTRMESSLLELFIEQKDQIATYAQIEELWGDKFMSINSLRTLIKNLRQKTHTDLIENLPNIGYRLNLGIEA